MDGTNIFMWRPGGPNENQRSCYSGRKRRKCLVNLTDKTPDGLILYVYGPEVGRRHDITLYRQSGLDEELQQQSIINGVKFYLNADPAFILRPYLQVPSNRSTSTAAQQPFNNTMSTVRETVERSYKDVEQKLRKVDFSHMLKVWKALIAFIYKWVFYFGIVKLVWMEVGKLCGILDAHRSH